MKKPARTQMARDILDEILDDFEWCHARKFALRPNPTGGWEVVGNIGSIFNERIHGQGENPISAVRNAREGF